MLKGDSYWGASGSTAEVVKTDKKDKKAPKAAAAKGAKGVKVGAKKGKGARVANKDPKVLKAQQAAKQLLAAKKVRLGRKSRISTGLFLALSGFISLLFELSSPFLRKWVSRPPTREIQCTQDHVDDRIHFDSTKITLPRRVLRHLVIVSLSEDHALDMESSCALYSACSEAEGCGCGRSEAAAGEARCSEDRSSCWHSAPSKASAGSGPEDPR